MMRPDDLVTWAAKTQTVQSLQGKTSGRRAAGDCLPVGGLSYPLGHTHMGGCAQHNVLACMLQNANVGTRERAHSIKPIVQA